MTGRALWRALEAALVAAVIGAAVVWLSGGLAERIPPGEISPPTVTRPRDAAVATVELVRGPTTEWASGALASARRTVVSSRILARIQEAPVTAGDEVAPGDVLFVLDARDLEARVEQAREALRAAEAERELARTEKQRADELLRRGTGTRQRFDQAVSGLRVAEAEVERRARALEEAETALSYAVIKAPVGGRVVDRLAEPGDMAAPGEPLMRIYDPTRLRVEAPVRETLAVGLAVGQQLLVDVSAVGERFEGAIDEIVPFAEPGARTLLVKVRLPADPRLFAGMFARIAVPAGERASLLVPVAAVERVGQLEFVTVVRDGERLERRLVTTGEAADQGRIEVLSGLAEGERVVVPAEAGPEPDHSAKARG